MNKRSRYGSVLPSLQLQTLPFLLALIAITLVSLPQLAQAQVMASVGGQFSLEQANDGRNIEARQPWAVRAGYRFREVDAYLEYSRFRAAQGVEMIEVIREHHEVFAWLRRVIRRDWVASPFVALGLGAQTDVVQTRLGDEHAHNHGNPMMAGALAGGAQVMIGKNLDLIFEGRMAVSSNLAPNPLLSTGAYIGLNF